MPMQQTNSSFVKQYGARVANANAEYKDKPVDTGNRRLPSGIRDGVAKLSTMYTKEQTEDNQGKTPKGSSFFRASAIVISPAEFNGEKVAGLVTQQMVPLCDVPAKGNRKAVSFEQNYGEMQNIIRLCGVAPCPETIHAGMSDAERIAVATRIEAYWFAAMKMLIDPVRIKTNPVYISFSTRGWTPPATVQQPKPEEMVFEEWHGLAQAPSNGQPEPGAGMKDNSPTTAPSPVPPHGTFNEFTPPAPPPQAQPATPVDRADEVASLVEVAMADPDGATEEGAQAGAQLAEMAWDNGWSKDQTANAADWAAVGDMALNPPSAQQPTPAAPTTHPAPTVGGKYKFCKRTKDGAKLKNNKGEEFPPQEVEVVTVDTVARTCTVKTTKDGKMVVDIRTKQPVAVKFEWLE